ncbi:GPN-loop GTPase 3 [Folsomia candida]|uniref:GPN-loop GTPase 3 n=1 Tax=Folsomia candida TaxID=158441 RepID=A0A481T0C7_FOLCA|nr:GPN-loop GTPase 3 [Folsomia candida]QBH74284.1 hypothetical protein [Folsomia candida]
MRFAQIVMGPAGTGKSTYCSHLEKRAEASHRNIRIVNLDPAAETFNYEPLADVRELIQVEDVMEDEDLHLGPNGALLYCMEFLMDNLESWLLPAIGEQWDGDYLVFDCPGQIELYTHMDTMQRFVKQLQDWDFRLCGIYTIDAHFLTDGNKFIAGSLTALGTMINLEIPHMNILTKMDLLSKHDRKNIERFLEPDALELLNEEIETPWNKKFLKLSEALGKVLEDYSLVKYFPLDIRKESNMENLLLMADLVMGVSEDADVKVKDPPEEENQDDD